MRPYQQGVGIVVATPCQLWPVACLAAESEGIFKMGRCLLKLTHGPGQEPQEAVICHAAKYQHEAPQGLQDGVLLSCRRGVAPKYRHQPQASSGEQNKLTITSIA